MDITFPVCLLLCIFGLANTLTSRFLACSFVLASCLMPSLTDLTFTSPLTINPFSDGVLSRKIESADRSTGTRMREGRKSRLLSLAGEKCHSYRTVKRHDSRAKSRSFGFPWSDSRDRDCKELVRRLLVWLNGGQLSKRSGLIIPTVYDFFRELTHVQLNPWHDEGWMIRLHYQTKR